MVELGTLNLHEGKPAICIPVMGKNTDALLAEIAVIKSLPCNIIEWRADYMIADLKEHSLEEIKNAVVDVLKSITDELEIPLLFTIRTSKEGGEAEMTDAEYFGINTAVAESGFADFIDIEAFSWGEPEQNIRFIDFAHDKSTGVILSNHDFEKTPALEIMIDKYASMIEMGGDIAKLAVMPSNDDDVACLLEAAALTKEQHPQQMLIAISMGETGMISRICAGQFGSVMTFASGKTASAPGQIDAITLQGYLERYYK